MTKTKDPSWRAALEDDVEQFEEDLRDESANTKLGDYNLIAEGLEEFKQVLILKDKKDSKRVGSDLEFVL